MAITLNNNAVGTIPLVFLDASGQPVPPPAGGTVASSNPDYLTATLGADGATVTLTTPPGTTNITAAAIYHNPDLPGITATETVTIAAPVPVSVSFNEASYKQAPVGH